MKYVSIELWDMALTFNVLIQQDLPNAMNAAELTEKLDLHSLRQRSWYIQATCAPTEEGLYEGLDWMSKQMSKGWFFSS
jgi:hypothetical protein